MLVRHLLKSSICIASTIFLNPAFAATIVVGVDTMASGFNDYQFTANVDLDVNEGINIANSGGNSIVSTGVSQGRVNFFGSSVITGNVGVLGGNRLDSVSLGNGVNSTVIFQGQVESSFIITSFEGSVIFEQAVGSGVPSKLGIGGSGTVIFKAQANIEDSEIGSPLRNDSILAIFEGPVNFASDVEIFSNARALLNGGGVATKTVTLSQAANIDFLNNYTITQDLIFSSENASAQVLSGKIVTITDDINRTNVADKIQLNFDLDFTAAPGKFAAGNQAFIQPNDKVNIIQPGLPAYVLGANGPLTIVSSGTVPGILIPELNAPNNLFISFDLSVDGTNKLLQLTGTRVMPTGLQNNIAGVAEILGSITTTNAPNEFIDLGNQLGLYYGTETQKEALATAAPINDGAFNQVVFDIQQNTFDLFTKRIEEQFVHLDNYHTGYAAGLTNEQGNGSWVKLFGNYSKQSTRENINGYHSGVWGVALGLDSKISDTSLLGASFSWASASVSHDIGGSNTNINHYQGALYGSKHNDNNLFLNGMLSLAYNQYDAAHNIVINNFNRTNFAHFHGWQYAARIESGYHYFLKQDLFEIQPIVSLSYAHANFNSYQEKGSSLTAQKITYENMNTLIADIGVKVLDEIKQHQYRFIREAHASIGYDLIGDSQKSTAQYVGFGSAYQTESFSPAQAYYNIGLSLTTYGNQHGIGVSFGYDYFWKQNYHAHAGFLKLKYHWH